MCVSFFDWKTATYAYCWIRQQMSCGVIEINLRVLAWSCRRFIQTGSSVLGTWEVLCGITVDSKMLI